MTEHPEIEVPPGVCPDCWHDLIFTDSVETTFCPECGYRPEGAKQ